MTDVEELIASNASITGDADTKRQCIAVLRSMVGRRIYVAKGKLVSTQRRQLAAQLLHIDRMTTAEAAFALTERLQVSRRTAQRLVRQARRIRQARLSSP